MPGVRQVRRDVDATLAAARANDLDAMTAAGSRANAGAAAITSAITSAVSTWSSPRPSGTERWTLPMVTVAILGEQTWSMTTAGVPDGRAVGILAEAMKELDLGLLRLVEDLRLAGLGDC